MKRSFAASAFLSAGCLLTIISLDLGAQTTDTSFTATADGFTSNNGGDITANDGGRIYANGISGGFFNTSDNGFVDEGGGGFCTDSGRYEVNAANGVGFSNVAFLYSDDSLGVFGPFITQTFGLTPESTSETDAVPFVDFNGPGSTGQTGFESFHLDGRAGTNSLVIHPDGIGIGLGGWRLGGPVPKADLHVYSDGGQSVGGTSPFKSNYASILAENVNPMVQDRNMLSLENNGSVFVNLWDKSPSGSQWQIFTTQGRFSLRKAGPNSPGMTIRDTGDFVFANLGQTIMSLKPNGNMFVRGNINTFGTVNGSSDRNLKENIRPVDQQKILAKVASMPISTWNYIHDEKDIPHMGPMAQDFSELFALGDDDKSIAFVDKDGVALAAIQALYQNDSAKDKKLAELVKSDSRLKKHLKQQSDVIESQNDLIAELTDRLERLESVVSSLEQK